MENYKAENEDVLKLLAKKYTDYYGSSLKEEAKMQNNLKTIPSTPRLDKIVESLIADNRYKKKQRKTWYRNLSLVAASILIIIATPIVINLRQNSLVDNPATGGYAKNAYDTVEERTEKDFTSQENTPSNDAISSDIQPEHMMLNFSIPSNLSVINIEQDIGETIYHLKDENFDDIVMILSKEEENVEEQEMDFEIIKVNSKDVYAKSTANYNMILFVQDNIMYKLTCKYDINTLIDFGESILV